MGTNFYHHEAPPCESCGRPHDAKHIGKSSAGWCFSLRVYPSEGITTLEHWKARFFKGEIRDEYGTVIRPDDLLWRITERAHPHGLSRHDIDGRFCIGHGEGTWDYMLGEFS